MMAAAIAIMLYLEVPRVAFEAQREKEQLLIDRGEQYKRAIQLYVRKYSRFPTDIAALENTQNIRFLRKQYVDPMTGKNEWRLIHMGPGGVPLDSKVTKPKKDASGPQNFITEMQQIGGNSAPNQNVNLATRRRPSDDPGGASDPNNPVQPGSGSNPGAINGPVMVLPDGRIVPATPTGVPAPPAQTPGGTGNAAAGGGSVPSTGLPPGFQPPGGVGFQPPGSTAYPPAGAPGGFAPPAPSGFQNTPNAPPSSAANLIQQILTTPRPGGLSGIVTPDPNAAATAGANSVGGLIPGANNTGMPVAQAAGTQTIGGGIGGVASKLEQEGIKTYNKKTAYDEWEFVYDMSKDPMRGGSTGVTGQSPVQQQGQQSGQTQTGQTTQTGFQTSLPTGSAAPGAPNSAPGGTTGTP